MKLKSVSFGFVTNSSTYVTTVIVRKKDLIEKLQKLNKNEIKKILNEKFKQFITEDLDICEDEFWSNFIQEVKKSVFEIIEDLKKFAATFKEKDVEFLCLESSCDINGNTIDTFTPEAYALWFVLKYILDDISVNTETCYC